MHTCSYSLERENTNTKHANSERCRAFTLSAKIRIVGSQNCLPPLHRDSASSTLCIDERPQAADSNVVPSKARHRGRGRVAVARFWRREDDMADSGDELAARGDAGGAAATAAAAPVAGPPPPGTRRCVCVSRQVGGCVRLRRRRRPRPRSSLPSPLVRCVSLLNPRSPSCSASATFFAPLLGRPRQAHVVASPLGRSCGSWAPFFRGAHGLPLRRLLRRRPGALKVTHWAPVVERPSAIGACAQLVATLTLCGLGRSGGTWFRDGQPRCNGGCLRPPGEKHMLSCCLDHRARLGAGAVRLDAP